MGNKNSGRRPLGDRQKRQAIIDKAWALTEKYIDDESIDINKRIEVAIKLAVKDMPDKLTDGDGDPLPTPVFIFNTKKNDSEDTTIRPEEIVGSVDEARVPV